jgi:precorrin-6A/cobalt-precorrin-6A reductase
MTFKVLILGGTSEGRRLAERLDGAALLSYAGRTVNLQRPSLPHRVGGFGGVEGLTRFLRDEAFEAVVDATHPFAAQMSRNAAQACRLAAIPLLRFEPPAWERVAGDDWTEVPDIPAAARLLAPPGPPARRIFLSIGRLEVASFQIAPQHDYLIRAIDPFDPGLPQARVLTARGPFQLEDEQRLLQHERIDLLVSKNAGTPSTYPKLEAARRRAIPVIMVQRPLLPAAETVGALADAIAWLERLRGV